MLAWDAAQTYWNAWVIGYGPELQRALLEALGISRPHWSKLVALAAGAVLFVSVLLTVYLSWSFRRKRKRDRAVALFERFCRRLERARIPPRRAGEGPLDYGNRAAIALPLQAGEIEAITRAYIKSRYEPNTGNSAVEELRRLVRGFKPVGAH
jgi:hypothetical protein